MIRFIWARTSRSVAAPDRLFRFLLLALWRLRRADKGCAGRIAALLLAACGWLCLATLEKRDPVERFPQRDAEAEDGAPTLTVNC